MTEHLALATTAPFLVEQDSVSTAWSEILIKILDNSGTIVAPLVVSLQGFDENGDLPEDADLRTAIDGLYELKQKSSVDTVAFTIFPQRYWEMSNGDRSAFFKLYQDSFPRMQAMNRPLNGRGLYFERLVDFGSGPCSGNQLEWIISQYLSRKGIRKSMFQASIFDPKRDHIPMPYMGFPCLQHVSFVPSSAGLVVNAFYATQQIFDKAYGNYLGLTQLGKFMAKELQINLSRINIFVGVAKLERITKTDSDLEHVAGLARLALAKPIQKKQT